MHDIGFTNASRFDKISDPQTFRSKVKGHQSQGLKSVGRVIHRTMLRARRAKVTSPSGSILIIIVKSVVPTTNSKKNDEV